MANQITGGTFDLYREQVVNNPATYTGTQSDDFRDSAVRPQSPTQTNLARGGAYATQATVDSWQGQLRQKEIQV